jgi:hypothetical protein
MGDTEKKTELPIGNLPPEGCMVGIMDDDIIVNFPKQRMTKPQALNLAAWIVVIADPTRKEFEKFYEAICST